MFLIAFNDEWRSSMQLLSYKFFRVYHIYHIYSLDASDFLEKNDLFVAESLSTELSVFILIDGLYIIVCNNQIYNYYVD